MADDDDHYRVGAREVVGFAGRAEAHLAASGHAGLLSADAAESMPRVPVDLHPGLRHYPGFGEAECHRGVTRFLEPASLVRNKLAGGLVIQLGDVDSKAD